MGMICYGETKWLVTLRNAKSFMRWMVCREKSIEYAVKMALANETDVADFNWVLISRVWIPQGMTETRICFSKLFAISIIVRRLLCHEGLEALKD